MPQGPLSTSSYQYLKVARDEWPYFSAWKEAWMSWWWIEGRRRRKKPNPKKEKWVPLYCATDERKANLLVKQIRGFMQTAPDPKDRSATKEQAALSRYDDFRVVAPELPPARGKKGRKSEKSTAFVKGSVQKVPECPGCGVRDAKKVRRGEKRLWKCLNCSRRWPRTVSEAPQRPSKGSGGASRSNTPEKRPRKRQKPSKKGSKK